jgi:glutamyl-Q tRNA(Asp) synthetase
MFATRFAPSPTGLLHLGHAFSALSAFDAARSAGGRFLLRIEDTDPTRCRPDFEAAIYEDLAWLGITWEVPVRRQSDHMDDYGAMLARLIDMGVLYRCFKTRKDVMSQIADAPHGPQAAYRGAPLPPREEAKLLAKGAAFAWRLSLTQCIDTLDRKGRPASILSCQIDGIDTHINTDFVGDIVVARKEFLASYHLACVHDDALQGVTHVIRGDDLREAVHVHVLLQALLDLPTPIYSHHRLILDAQGKRLAKRDGAVTLRTLRGTGATRDHIRAQLGLMEAS